MIEPGLGGRTLGSGSLRDSRGARVEILGHRQCAGARGAWLFKLVLHRIGPGLNRLYYLLLARPVEQLGGEARITGILLIRTRRQIRVFPDG